MRKQQEISLEENHRVQVDQAEARKLKIMGLSAE
jgi:hypothetical protein